MNYFQKNVKLKQVLYWIMWEFVFFILYLNLISLQLFNSNQLFEPTLLNFDII